jgi:gamma-glutamyltranspeptidase/glutathione hydrolase
MRGAVTASTQQAADAGAAALRAGGNAVDAAVAAALASCVADPCNTGIGGYGGYLVVRPAGASAPQCVAFPVSPPPALPREAFERAAPDSGPLASTVPNVVAGLAQARARFGVLPWERLCEGALRLAAEGVVANATTHRAFALHRAERFVAECFEFAETTFDGAPALVFRQPRLARTLERLAAEGPDWFYEGPLAEAAVDAWSAAGGGLDASDWRTQARAVFCETAAAWMVGDIHIASAALGLSGSATLFAYLQAAGRIAARGALVEPAGLADLATAFAAVWQYRAAPAGGYDFAATPLARWIEQALAGAGSAVAAVPLRTAPEHTAHINAVDRAGGAAALTFTHGPRWFGGRWCLAGSGVLMNAGMVNCTSAALVRRGTRWIGVSNMCPTIVERRGRRVAVGCPGARRIPSNVALVIARHLLGGTELQASVSAGRFHAETADCAFAELDRLPAPAVEALRARFGTVEPERDDHYYGPLTAVGIDPSGGVEAAVDDRGFRGFAAWAS